MRITELFDKGEFVVTAEVGPPKGVEIDHLIKDAHEYLKTRVHALNVTDNQSSVMRTGSLATCKVLKDEGLLPIFQITCRDRNRIALQSDVLSAALLGIENLLLLTGDYTTLGDHPQAKPVFDLDSVSLTHAVKRLEEGFDLAGNEVDGTPPKFAKGAVVSPCSDSVDVQLAKMEAKVKAGTEYFQTQGVYEPEKFFSFMEKAKQFGVPVQLGVIIPKNVGMCRYMNANVAGVHVPDDMIEELKKDKERTKSGDVGVELCAKIIKECKDHCDGVHIMSLGWENRIPEILDLAGVAPVK
ncbi:MAG: methylenetetrahydrofolate reductase [Eubacteriaceae bacterium]|jgi:5,10-methylenetetrahydrofolate reductase|nr:methylenetetrahydrofolate reductase [Eubacteriaceae bacterium]MDK2937520.1 methylenetetrahydrofolate reductase [Eubacteriaceae bacterium]MDN5307472.1 methylenetetrahydrofolate reductase [Eubacteriaceae bacterium]